APVLQTPKATSSTLYFDSLTVNAGNGGFLHCIQMDTSVNAANQVVSVGADIAFDADPKFFACLVRLVSDKLLDLVGLGGKSAADKGKDTRDYLAAAFPELNAWERAGADASSAGMVDAG